MQVKITSGQGKLSYVLNIIVTALLACHLAPLWAGASTDSIRPSFSCSGGSLGQVERLICSDVDLAKLDRHLADAYRGLMSDNTQDRKKYIRKTQRNWLSQVRNACIDGSDVRVEAKLCLQQVYQDRIMILENEKNQTRDPALINVLQLLRTHFKWTENQVYYQYVTFDLNADGREEYIFYFWSPMICGSGGCQTLVYSSNAQGDFRQLSGFTVSRRPIHVISSKHHGWYDLAIQVSGGGIYKSYYEIVQFRGGRYSGLFDSENQKQEIIPDSQILQTLHSSSITDGHWLYPLENRATYQKY